jgi:hypothetical protein
MLLRGGSPTTWTKGMTHTNEAEVIREYVPIDERQIRDVTFRRNAGVVRTRDSTNDNPRDRLLLSYARSRCPRA